MGPKRMNKPMEHMITDRHLGGFVEGGDIATEVPEVWDYLIDEFNVTSMLDIGCGEGWAAKYFLDKGVDAYGIDGTHLVYKNCQMPPERITIVDYEQASLIWGKPIDLIWCCEFVEHINGGCINNFLRTFDCAKYIAMTHAFPGQAGHHHVNCQTSQYWIDLLKEHKFQFDGASTAEIRRTTIIAAQRKKMRNYGMHISRSMLMFRKV